ncbi:MAG: hypothetical protein K9J45_20525, partial [Bacteroidales bacterium]|nr:hypothetical protein [Bacteroidales bacterium]
MNPVSNYVFRCMLCVAFMLSQFFASALTCKNGVFVTLNGDAEATVSAEEFVLYSNSCCGSGLNYDLSLNNGASFQPNATLNCDDLGQLPIRVRFTDCLGVVNFCESFVIVQGNLGICDVGCGGCCLPNVKFQPLTVSFYDDYSLKLHASWFNDGSYSDCATGALQFSFSSNPNDTLKTYTCDDLGQSAVQLWVTDAGGNQSFGETFVIAQFAFGDCTGTGPCLPAPVAYNGIVVPLNPVGEASVHARGFDLASHVSTCSSATSFTMAFSDDPNDTLAFFTCDDVGQQLVQIFVHDNLGNVNYIETFVIVQDLSDYCDPSGNLVPPNDDVCNAYDINYLINSGCKEYFFNIGADAGTSEVTPPMGACGVPNTWCDAATVAEKTVWFKFEAPATHEIAITTTGMNTQLALWTAESCGVLKAGFAALIAANDDDLSLTGGGSRLVAECLEAGKTYYVQMDGHSNTEGVFGLNFTATGPPCDVSTSESKLIENGFAILPNPASALVNLGVQTPANWLGGQAVMTDVGGKVVLVQNIDGENIPLYIDHL